MFTITLLCLLTLSQAAKDFVPATLEAQAAQLRALVAQSPKLPLQLTTLGIQSPADGWALDMVSSAAADRTGVIWLLQRGDKADPVVAVNRDGRVLRSWGKGLFKIPHSIRIDPDGHIWTVDAASSVVLKFDTAGKKLLEIPVGGQPSNPRSAFCGTTDLAFGPHGRIFISDGYANARILEYTAEGQRVREWGAPGTGPGQFRLPHGITIDKQDVLYVADRENGRIQRFDLDGRYLGEWSGFGKTFSLTFSGAALWIGTQPRNETNGAPGWLMKIDPANGKLLGSVASTGHHSIDVTANGELLTGTRPNQVLWFRALR